MVVEKKASKKKVASKSTLSAEPEPVQEQPVVNKQPAPQSPAVEEENNYESQFVDVQEKLLNIISSAKSVQADVKKLQKDFAKMQKEKSKKKRRQSSDKKKEPSGFAKPTPLTDAMCVFLELKKGSFLSRTDVTRGISKYIREHDLQNPNNRREIFPNKDLRKLLAVPQDAELTFFNLQKYLKVHFLKPTPPPAPST